MALFQNSVLNKYLNSLDDKKVSEAWKAFASHFHNPEVQENIRNSKEEEYQEGFLDDLFVKVLGYTKYPTPNFNLRVEQKDEIGSKKADGALLDGDKVKAVIELKGTDTTDLGKVEAQAFGYKNKQSDAIYVIISNFEKVRFYIDNAVEFIEFNLFLLSEEEFKVLWLCLSHDSFSKNLPKRIKDKSLSEEESITKTLYKDYSAFKHDILDNIVALNPGYDKLLLFRKTQKLLDRFLFVFFAEDRALLPPNSIRQVITQWMDLRDKYDEYVPLYERFKKYFGYMNEGHKGKKHDIFAYNGGLFAPDEVLDTIKIDDNVLYKHSLQLSNYDFESDVDVNILGHIFEHSLNEIEEITAEIKGEVVDSSKTKRKKDGVFYTPKYITKYIVENTVGKLCNEKKIELNIIDERFIEAGRRTKKGVDDLKAYRDWLLSLTICDPACGSGAFLNQALEFLIAEHKYLDELTAKYHNSPLVLSDIENSILENNLYGVDINDEAVEIAKLSLWLRTAQRGRKLTTLNHRIKCGNSLIDDPEVAGGKAFNWETEFPEVFTKKHKQAFHVTWVSHNARTSQRMIEYKIKKGEGIWLDEELEMVVAKALAEMITEDKLNVMTFNICGDHVHMLLVCEPEELQNIVRKLKGKSAQKTKEHLNVPKEETFHLWAQKFNRKALEDEEDLANVYSYITDNRIKHNLPINKGLQPLVSEVCVDYEQAFAPEYSGGFDVVIGNPPYVDIKGLNKELINYLFRYYKSANNRVNLYSSFIEKGMELIKKDGAFSFIIPSSLLTQSSYKELRLLILSKTTIKNIIRLPNESFGGSAGDVKVDTIILTFRLGKCQESQTKVIVYKGFERINEISEYNSDMNFLIDSSEWLDNDESVFRINISSEEKEILRKCEIGSINLNECSDFCLGLTPYDKYKGHSQEQIKNRVFHSSIQEDSSFKKLLAGNDIRRYDVKWGGTEWISYGEWLGAPREKRFFTEKRILVKQIIDWSDKRIWAAYTELELYNTQNAFNIIPNENYLPEYLLALINSKLLSFYHRKQFLEEFKDRFQKILIKEAKMLPIKIINIQEQERFVNKSSIIITQTNTFILFINKFVSLLLSKFDIDKLSRKLENWHELSFKEFLKELKKKKVALSLSEEAEWMDYFNQEKEKAQALQAQINQTDQEIDQMVYELYGLTEEEIAIVEGNI